MSKKTATGCRPIEMFGHWAIEAIRFNHMVQRAESERHATIVAAINAVRADGSPSSPLPTLSPERPGKKKADDGSDEMMQDTDEGDSIDSIDDDSDLYDEQDGVAMIHISGPMTKYTTSFQDIFGGTSTLGVRRALRVAAKDPDVECVMLCIESPGGTVSGMTDLAADIRAVNATKKVYAYIQDLGCSAAYWAASQCERVYANIGAEVGSIGAFARIVDSSGAAEKAGYKVHVISTGPFKGAGTEGAPITDDQLADFQRHCNDLNDLFVADVATGRNMTPTQVRAIADGRVFVGEKAKALGLVDEIASFDSAMQAAKQENPQMNLEQFKQFAAETPDAVKDFQAQGHKAGRASGYTEARTELAEMLAAFPGREAFAAQQFAKGKDVTAAKAALADVLAEENKAQAAKILELTAKAAEPESPAPSKTPLVHAGANGSAGDAKQTKAEWDAKVKAFQDGGLGKPQAVACAVRDNPELHAAYVAAVNEENAAKRKAR